MKVKFDLCNATGCDTTVEVKVKKEQVRKRIFTVLSIDGGGIRGIIPAMILAYIEKQIRCRLPDCNEKCQPRIANYFDLIAGTSTGGIIALALTKPDHSGKPAYTAEDLVELYLDQGENIFNRSKRYRALSGWGWLNKKYPADGIEQVLETYFKNTRLCEAITRVLIPSYDMRGARVHWKKKFDCRRGGHPRFFKSYPIDDLEQSSEDGQCQSKDCAPEDSDTSAPRVDNHLMRDVARVTSAAPTYFKPLELDFYPR